MKKYIIILGIILSLYSCKQEGIPIYSYKTNLISFDSNDEKSVNYSFISRPNSVMQDTVWFNVLYTGFTKNKDANFEIEQVIPQKSDEEKAKPNMEQKAPKYLVAKPGVHYVDFNDPEYKKLLKFDANKFVTRLPIIVLRDSSLKRSDAKLTFKLKSNNNFGLGYKEYQTHEVIISDQLVKPNLWINYFFGAYGPVKHRFMIDKTGNNWDDEYLKRLGFRVGGKVDEKADQEYIQNIVDKLKIALKEENKKRKEQGLEDLKEDDGTFVNFSNKK